MRPLQVYRNWRQRLALIRSFELRPTDLVLEVGSGHNPTPRADVLCERFVADSSERHGQRTRIDRPFVVGDIYDLPFRDGAFDFVVCTHVLEHLADPRRALSELSRVAPRGFVETPSSVNEKLLSYPFHLWYILLEDDTLVFRAKDRAIHDPELGRWMDRLADQLPGFTDFFFEREEELGNVVRALWEGRLPCRIEGVPKLDDEAAGHQKASSSSLDEEIAALRRISNEAHSQSGPAELLYRLVSRFLRRSSAARARLADLLACPACGAHLAHDDEHIECSCGARYPVVREGGRTVPVLIKQDAADG